MPEPMAICIEDLDAQSRAERFLRCVAVVGRQPGLRLDAAGRVLWRSEDRVSCELWVSADEQLILYRPENALPSTLHRAGRSLQVPVGKPVVVAHGDEVQVGSKRLRIHLHGLAPAVTPPSPLPGKPRKVGRVAQAAAVVGALAATSGILVRCDPPDVTNTPKPATTIQVRDDPPEPTSTPVPKIEIRDDPPEVAPFDPDQSVIEAVMGDWQVEMPINIDGEQVWITGTLTMESDRYRFASSQPVTGTLQGKGLVFLAEHPEGWAYLNYWVYDPMDDLTTGEQVAYCEFQAGDQDLLELIISVKDANTLQFMDLSYESEGWSITRQWR